jgi:hypothetical protein
MNESSETLAQNEGRGCFHLRPIVPFIRVMRRRVKKVGERDCKSRRREAQYRKPATRRAVRAADANGREVAARHGASHRVVRGYARPTHVANHDLHALRGPLGGRCTWRRHGADNRLPTPQYPLLPSHLVSVHGRYGPASALYSVLLHGLGEPRPTLRSSCIVIRNRTGFIRSLKCWKNPVKCFSIWPYAATSPDNRFSRWNQMGVSRYHRFLNERAAS